MSQAKVLSEAEMKRVLAVVAQHGILSTRNRLAVLLSHWAGMRAGEIAALKIMDVVNEGCAVRDRIHLSASQTKGNRGRTVFINTKLQREIARYLEQREWTDERKPLIRSQKGGHFTPTTMVMLFRRIYDEAGLADARSHSGRRSYLTTLANKGVSVFVLQQLAGHQSIQTTQRYVTVNEEMMVKAAELA
ncbi:integrase [Paramagnetospirillum marisnigri]|uniref:Integrase n=1 Tax=Paramagnetospirillum marisnigri TaxID=1285242 RepID=A0A178MHU0_9PROT|nr:site-specific integrase [Paramagnetospirillum marisnigri]OAN48200.1 integrase [Paramagnetospirillum marisnigri]